MFQPRIEPPPYLLNTTPTGSMRGIISSMFHWKLDDIRNYIRTVEIAFKEKLDAAGADFDKRTEGMSDAEKSHYAEWSAGDTYQLVDDFPELMWQTAFIYTHSHFEHSLLTLCDSVRSACRIQEEFNDREGIKAARRFLIDLARIPIPCEGPNHGRAWREVFQMNELRNIFVHALGHVYDEPSNELRAYLEQKTGLIEVDVTNRIHLKEGYCFQAIDVIEKCFSSVLDAVPDSKLW